MWGHVLAVRRGTTHNSSQAFIPLEITAMAILVAGADVWLLAVSGGLPTAIRDPVRLLGGLLAAGIVVWVGCFVCAAAAWGFLAAIIDDVSASRELTLVPRVAVGVVGLAAGSGDGALVAIYGPIVFVSMGIELVLAGYLGLSQVRGRRRHPAAALSILFLCSCAVSGAVVASYVLAQG